MSETQTPVLDVLHLPLALKQEIAQSWIEKLKTVQQTDSFFRVKVGDVCEMCVVGTLLDACVDHGIGEWTCNTYYPPAVDGVAQQDTSQVCGFTLPGSWQFDDWTSAMVICAQFSLFNDEQMNAYLLGGLDALPQSQEFIDLIDRNDNGDTFADMLPDIKTLVSQTLAIEP